MNLTALKEEMDRRNLSSSQLAEESGLHRATVYRILNGERTPTVYAARKIVDAMKLSATTAKRIFFEDERA